MQPTTSSPHITFDTDNALDAALGAIELIAEAIQTGRRDRLMEAQRYALAVAYSLAGLSDADTSSTTEGDMQADQPCSPTTWVPVLEAALCVTE
jgi:hypothetical protein